MARRRASQRRYPAAWTHSRKKISIHADHASSARPLLLGEGFAPRQPANSPQNLTPRPIRQVAASDAPPYDPPALRPLLYGAAARLPAALSRLVDVLTLPSLRALPLAPSSSSSSASASDASDTASQVRPPLRCRKVPPGSEEGSSSDASFVLSRVVCHGKLSESPPGFLL